MIRTNEKLKIGSMAVALLAVLSMTGTGWAKKSFAGPGLSGAFVNGARTSVEVTVPVQPLEECGTAVAPATESYTVKAYIFQPSGRMFAIGIGDATTFTCSSSAVTDVLTTVDAFPGLDFKPGPATLLFKVMRTVDPDGAGALPPEAEVVVDEYGYRIELH